MKHTEWLFGGLAVLTIGLNLTLSKQGSAKPVSPYQIPPLDTQLYGSTRWLADSRIGLRLVTMSRARGTRSVEPIQARFRVMLQPQSANTTRLHPARVVYEGTTNAHGVADIRLDAPERAGNYRLKIEVNSPLGVDQLELPITVEERAQILLTTDKPIYQPGQTVHLRALCLRKPDMRPAANAMLTFEVRDPKGNMVYRVQERVSHYGIAAAEFPLANEIALGEYRVSASLQASTPDERPDQAERTFRVERYLLPKFKVELTTAERYYLPGETLQGTVRANYFFGKAVSRGEAIIRLSTFDTGWHQFAELKGTLDENGSYQFSVKLPETFVGLPLEKGNALMRVEAFVTDRAGHTERTAITLPVSEQPINVALIPESATLKPGIPMRLYVLTTYPDGTPAPCRFRLTLSQDWAQVSSLTAEGETDALGIGVPTVRLAVLPASAIRHWPPLARRVLPSRGDQQDETRLSVDVQGEVWDARGNRVTIRRELTTVASEQAILLRTSKSLAKVGESLKLELFAPISSNAPVFVDAILNRQTVLTRTVEMRSGYGMMQLPLTADLMGTLTLHAYRITPEGDIVRDAKVVIVEPADELQVKVSADKATYRPGETAQLRFTVTDRTGRPVPAALGVAIVDESVFALTEMQPGLERLYFMLEEELLKPRYEVHGWELRPVLLQPETRTRQRKRIAEALLAAASLPPLSQRLVSSYETRKQQVIARWREFVRKAAWKIARALHTYHQTTGVQLSAEQALDALLRAELLSAQDIRDPLGNPYRLKSFGRELLDMVLQAAGPDGLWDTDDDLTVYLATEWAIRRMAESDQGHLLDFLTFSSPHGRAARDVPRAAQAAPDTIELEMATPEEAGAQAKSATSAEQPTRVRQFFPETLLVQPALITDQRGEATLPVTLADSITTWRLTAMANSVTGQLGSTTAPIRVFQDFFVDIDLPLAFTMGDEVELPVALYNYLARSQTVRLRLDAGSGFQPMGATEQVVHLQPNEVTSVRFRLRAVRFGTHAITVYASGSAMSDAIKRTTTIVPDGKEMWHTLSDQLTIPANSQGAVTRTVSIEIPSTAIEGKHTLQIKIHAGALGQVLDGLENLLRMPFGCFEQTSSINYPNVLVLRYLKSTGKAMPSTEMKARQFITLGYQRLLTFEVKGGGFSWFGNPPAHQVLTAYGLLQFADMSRVHEIDPELIPRTVQWLILQQRVDGSWTPDTSGILEGAVNRQTDQLRTTAYITWAITEAAQVSGAVQKMATPAVQGAIRYLHERIRHTNDPYTLALMLNAFLGARELTKAQAVAERLARLARGNDEIAFWETSERTPFFGHGQSGDLETTALATYALIRHGGYAPLVSKALTYLVRHKDTFGTWWTTQATIWALKAFLTSAEYGVGVLNGTLRLQVNGSQVAEWRITAENADVVRIADAAHVARKGANIVQFTFIPAERRRGGALIYQISAGFHLPWELVPPEPDEPLQVRVQYDRTELQTREVVTCYVRVANRTSLDAEMVIVDIGIPPGFEVLNDDLSALVARKVLQKYELTPRQIICYLERIESQTTVEWSFRLRARMPVRARTGRTLVYEYYAPDRRGVAAPARLKVASRD
ncbi:MAG: MG2 domain-containing protein [Armatimonadota bacterium]